MSHRHRVRYTKLDRVRFVSARDLTAVWERALRRANLPIAYSEGFRPHAKVSFPDALSVGLESTGEYAELTFSERIDADSAFMALSATLPDGMDITTHLEVPDNASKLARLLPATLWRATWTDPAVDRSALFDLLDQRTRDLLAATTSEVVKHKPSGDKVIDVRAAVLDLVAAFPASPDVHSVDATGAPRIILSAVIRNDGPTVRPLDLLQAMRAADGGASLLPDPHRVTRVAQGERVDGGLREALTGEVVALAPGRLAGAA